MYSRESHVSPQSDYYVYAPSALAKKLYLYPVSVGHFVYEPGYQISRSRFDSFLIMYLEKGSCEIRVDGQRFQAQAGAFVLLDCYGPHQYGSAPGWEAAWLHFDGVLARQYFQEIRAHYGCVLHPAEPSSLRRSLERIYQNFKKSQPIIEPVLSSEITRILNGLLVPAAERKKPGAYTHLIADSVSYINEHFQEEISLEFLAKKANLSPFHFTRVFAKEIGATPHQYLLSTRISAAKFLLKSSDTPIKEIAFCTGFHSESGFCSTFKKWEGMTPGAYREAGEPPGE